MFEIREDEVIIDDFADRGISFDEIRKMSDERLQDFLYTVYNKGVEFGW